MNAIKIDSINKTFEEVDVNAVPMFDGLKEIFSDEFSTIIYSPTKNVCFILEFYNQDEIKNKKVNRHLQTNLDYILHIPHHHYYGSVLAIFDICSIVDGLH